ncbi:ATP-dependent Clp protease ATP-binding subunit ClpX [Geodia barretti]|uniref:ATP-dependent Clp protease ATP-binding subunit ClpX n=1 Tax=Geodia barretti TaxID=519541 RepID=A0AA35WJ08_GEOBA|nr:ATP-dependent Clp protease ATP-binding subunit ClpX [Geodia barretti]
MRPPGQPRGGICFDCIRELDDRVELTANSADRPEAASPTLVPRQIYAHLDAYVIGQERAKKTLSVAVITISNGFVAKRQTLESRFRSPTFC